MCRSSKRFRSKLNQIAVSLFLAVCISPTAEPATIIGRVSNKTQHESEARPGGISESLDSLRSRISAHVNQSRFSAARWGIKISSLDTGKTLFDLNSRKYFYPASNAKLFSAAVALDRLGPDFRIKTSLFAASKPDGRGVLKGDLIVYGRGDPSFAASLNDGDYYKALEPIVEALRKAGIRRIQGDVIADESFFRGPPFGSGWEWDDLQWYYGAEVSALSINDNAVDLMIKPAARTGIPCRVTTGPETSFVTIINRTTTIPKGSPRSLNVYRPIGENVIYVTGQFPVDDPGYTGYVAVHKPAGMFAALLTGMLTKSGIAVAGKPRSVDWKYREAIPLFDSNLVELCSIESPPLSEILSDTMKPSQNLYAQLLLLQIGAAVPRLRAQRERHAEPVVTMSSITGSRSQRSQSTTQDQLEKPDAIGNQTTEEAGLDELRLFLAEAGARRGEVLLEEGAGLSRRNLVTPDAAIALLSYMSRHKYAAAFRDALPVGGIDGTLKNRMKGTAAASNVRAKTGTLRYVNALSGYLTTAAGERLVFSIMLNDNYSSDGAGSSREDVDPIVVMLAAFTGHT